TPARQVRALNFGHDLEGWPSWALPAVGRFAGNALQWGNEAAAVLTHAPWNTGIRRLKLLIAASADPAYADERLLTDLEREREQAQPTVSSVSMDAIAVVAIASQVRE